MASRPLETKVCYAFVGFLIAVIMPLLLVPIAIAIREIGVMDQAGLKTCVLAVAAMQSILFVASTAYGITTLNKLQRAHSEYIEYICSASHQIHPGHS